MAETTSVSRRSKVFWTKLDMDSSGGESSDAFVPGVSSPGNRRPTRVWARRTKEVKAKIPVKQPVVETLGDSNISGIGSLTSIESACERSIRKLRQASLKDLCAEDKQRVANLIKELARVGDEREKAVHQLHGEREHFEKQLLTLVDQQEKILSEREDIQTKLFDCQELLTQYQGMILDKQDKLSTSVAGIKEVLESCHCGQCKNIDTANIPSSVSPIPLVITAKSDVEEKNLSPAQADTEHDNDSMKTRRAGSHEAAMLVEDELPMEKDMQNGRTSPRPGSSSASRRRSSRGSTESQPQVASIPTLTSADPREGLRRPFTSMIDKAIAAERSFSQSSHGGSVGSISPRSVNDFPTATSNDGRPKFSYPDRLPGFGPLHEPVMSSTQKSMELNAVTSFDTKRRDNSPSSSVKGLRIRPESPIESEKGNSRSKVVFSNRQETNEDPSAKMHSPNLNTGKKLRDPEYADYYKKLTSSGRKSELLKQRQMLLQEQERLQKILIKQESQLNRKQEELEARKLLQEQRMEFYKEGGKFPGLRSNCGGDDEPVLTSNQQGDCRRSPYSNAGQRSTDRQQSPRQLMLQEHQEAKIVYRTHQRFTSPVKRGDDIQIRNHVYTSGGSPRGEAVTRATSSPHPDSDNENEEEDDFEPRLVDVATSISFKSPLREIGNRQGNLPLPVNRHRTGPNNNKLANTKEQEHHHALGEKTLHVVNMVNSLDEPLSVGSHNNSYSENLTPSRRKEPAQRYLNSHRTSPAPALHRLNYYESPNSSRPGSRGRPVVAPQEDPEESREETRILEDVFFLQ